MISLTFSFVSPLVYQSVTPFRVMKVQLSLCANLYWSPGKKCDIQKQGQNTFFWVKNINHRAADFRKNMRVVPNVGSAGNFQAGCTLRSNLCHSPPGDCVACQWAISGVCTGIPTEFCCGPNISLSPPAAKVLIWPVQTYSPMERPREWKTWHLGKEVANKHVFSRLSASSSVTQTEDKTVEWHAKLFNKNTSENGLRHHRLTLGNWHCTLNFKHADF